MRRSGSGMPTRPSHSIAFARAASPRSAVCVTIVTHTALRGDAARAKAIEWLGLVGIPEPERRIDSYMANPHPEPIRIAAE